MGKNPPGSRRRCTGAPCRCRFAPVRSCFHGTVRATRRFPSSATPGWSANPDHFPLPNLPPYNSQSSNKHRRNGRRSNALPVIRHARTWWQPVITWNGKRGFVRDIACVRMCSVCIWTSPNECIPNRKSPEILQGFPMNTNGFPNNS